MAATLAFGAIAPPSDFQQHPQEYFDELEKKFAEKNDILYVHLVPHSHDDVGWLKSPTEYFTGSKMNIQVAYVENIIDTYITELIADPAKRFTQVEIKFFSMWWDE